MQFHKHLKLAVKTTEAFLTCVHMWSFISPLCCPFVLPLCWSENTLLRLQVVLYSASFFSGIQIHMFWNLLLFSCHDKLTSAQDFNFLVFFFSFLQAERQGDNLIRYYFSTSPALVVLCSAVANNGSSF